MSGAGSHAGAGLYTLCFMQWLFWCPELSLLYHVQSTSVVWCVLSPHLQSLRATEHLRSTGHRMRAKEFVDSSIHQGPWVPPPGKSTRSAMTWKVQLVYLVWVVGGWLFTAAGPCDTYVHSTTYVHSNVIELYLFMSPESPHYTRTECTYIRMHVSYF